MTIQKVILHIWEWFYEPKCWDWSMRLEYLNLGKKIAINITQQKDNKIGLKTWHLRKWNFTMSMEKIWESKLKHKKGMNDWLYILWKHELAKEKKQETFRVCRKVRSFPASPPFLSQFIIEHTTFVAWLSVFFKAVGIISYKCVWVC